MPTSSTSATFEGHALPSIESTRQLIIKLHDGQTDLSGAPYSNHPQRVARNVRLIHPRANDETIMAALLHDTLEDCDIDEAYLGTLYYCDQTIEMVRLLTKPANDTRDYEAVVSDLIASGNHDAMTVKIADNMDNLHPLRVSEVLRINPDKAQRLQARYETSIQRLCSETRIDAMQVRNLISASSPLNDLTIESSPQ